jgi:hypothetical protein
MMCRIKDVNRGYTGRTIKEEVVVALMVGGGGGLGGGAGKVHECEE